MKINQSDVLVLVDKVVGWREKLKTLVYEREELIDGMVAATISHDGVAVIGPKGTAKTMAGDLWAKIIDESELFKVMEQPGLSPEYEFGPVDIKEYTTTGRQVRNTENMMPSKKFVLIDEADKASDAIRFGQFPIIHPEERKFYNISAGVQAARAKFVYMTMNVKDTREELEPYFDRIALTFKVDYIQDAINRANFLRSTWNGGVAKYAPPQSDILGWDAIEKLHDAISLVSAPDDVIKTLERIDEGLRAEGISYSDRKLSWVPRLARVVALLNKRFEVRQEDLVIAKDMLWDRYEDKTKVEEVIMRSIDSLVMEARILYNEALNQLSIFDREYATNRKDESDEERKKRIQELAFDTNTTLKTLADNIEGSMLSKAENPDDASRLKEWVADIRGRNKRMMEQVLGITF